MKKLILFLGVFFITFLASAQTDLFFSEYIEGSGNNKGVEIYNPTDQPIELNNYYVVRYSNGSSVFTEGGVTQLEGTLQPYTTHVLINGQTESSGTSPACDPELQALADQLDHDYPAPTYMNGNDAIALLKTTNGIPPSATNPGTPVDLIGQIGLGSAISSETGWSYVQDSTLTYNNSNGDPITGKVINYIVQKYATNGSDYGPFWMSWTSNHSLIRKPAIITGVLTNPSPFIVHMQWDTLPAQLDPETGFYSYEDIWDNLGFHVCDAAPNSIVAVDDFTETGMTQLVTISVLDNDEFQSPVVLSIEQSATQGNSYIPAENQNVINYLPDAGFIGIDSITYKIADQVNPSLFSTAKVYIDVFDATPIAVNDQVETGMTQLVTISVLDNDIFQLPVVLSIEQSATQGNSYIPAENQNVINYLPDSGFVGIDSITYKIADQVYPTLFSTAKVYIEVINATTPIAVNDQAETGMAQLVTISVLENDIFQSPVVLSIEQSATQGNSYISTENQNVINYLPDSGFIGIDSITYKIADQADSLLFSTAKVYIDVVDDAGIEELSGQSNMVIYPNPVVSEHFTITSNEKIKSAQVFDIMGKEIINESFSLPQKEAVVKIGQNHKGIYMVKVTFMNSSSRIQKIIVK